MNHPIIILLRFTWRYAKGRRLIFISYITFSIIAHAILLLEPALIGKMLNVIQQGGDPDVLLVQIFKYLLIIFAIPFVFWIFHGISRIWERKTAFYIHLNYKQELLEQAFNLPLSWHRDHHSGENIDKINRATRALFDFSQNLFEPVQSITKLFGAYIALFIIMPVAGFVAVAVSVIAITSVVLYDRILVRQYREIYRLENKVASKVHDYLSNIVTVIAMRLEKISIKHVVQKMFNVFPTFRKNIILNEIKWFSVSAIISLMILVILGGHVYFTLKAGGILLVGTLYSLYAYLERISSSFYNFAWQYGEIIEQASAVQASQNITTDFKSHYKPTSFKLPSGWHAISIKNLHFTYLDEEKHRHHVDNLNLTLKRGSKIALVGNSGGGKSTTMGLLRGIHQADRVKVFADNQKMPHQLQHLHQYTTLLPQEPEIFADTIRYNITMGRTLSKKWLEKAIHLSCFKPVLKRLKKGLSTNIAEKGVNLSGGEKQRLALARGLLMARHSPIILMDEPTSSVDSKNEFMIYERIFKEYNHKAIIASVHRLHLLKMFDYIYLLDDGRIIEEGRLDDLIAQKKVFCNMWKAYFKTYKEIN